MAELSIEGLTKSFGVTRVLDGISMDIRSGEFISLLGLSGSGKTTILRCIAGLEAPDAEGGTIRLQSQVLSGRGVFVPPEDRHLGMVFQSYAVWPHLDVFENVAFPLRIRRQGSKRDETEIKRQVEDALQMVRLDAYATRYAHQLSGGQQQRVALARALVMKPRLLLLDEPLSNLDAILREELGAEIRRVQQSLGLTTILVTHDQREALSLSDRIIVLHEGRIEAQGRPEELYARPPSPFIAQFLSGGQSLVSRQGKPHLFLPRNWVLTQAFNAESRAAEGTWLFKLVSRIYLGNEYEYWGMTEDFPQPIRFFSAQRYEMGDQIWLNHPPSPCT